MLFPFIHVVGIVKITSIINEALLQHDEHFVSQCK